MATLSEEQKRRIEENKKKALAIRAAKLSNDSISNKPANHSSNTSISKKILYCDPLPVVTKNLNSCKTDCVPNKFNKQKLPNKLNFYSNVPSGNQNQSQTKVITVNFSLISKNRFTVDFLFNKDIVELLKTVPGKLYDPRLVRWDFPLSSYQFCKNLLQNNKEYNITIIPLPNFIIKVFIQQPKANVDFRTIDLSRIDNNLLSNLYPFQKEGVQFGVSKNGRCIIADDMGLGKTIQALGIAHYFYNDWPLLIVCPSSMRYQWEEEIRTNLPKLPITRIFVLSKSKEQIYNPLVLITSYDLMVRCGSQLREMKFGVIIMDESHSMKSLKTNRTKTAITLIGKASRCILLSGTPALSRPFELYPQIKALEPHSFSGKEFGIRYCDGKEGRFGWDYSGSSNMDELKILLEEKFMIRRLKSTVLNQLPAKIRQVVILDKEAIKSETKTMSALSAKLSNEKIKGMERRGTLLSYFAETAKIKLKAIKDYICQILEMGNKFLIFAHHKEVLNEISKLLEEKQTYVCDQFQYEEKFKVAVLSITAASTGLTLTAANLVIFAELFWNPGILTQAEDRVHRIGQENSVLVQYLIATGTADDYLWPLIKTKLNILNQAGLSKDNFACEHTTMITNSDQHSITDYFNEIDFESDLNDVEFLEKNEYKRLKLNE
ncbi:hypothetical protein PGB90_007930 [Kerria lacca]